MQSCPSCGQSVETAGLEPFGKVDCPNCGHQLRVERVFENYLVVEPLATGGMGSVYKARDTRLNRFVALKLLCKEFAGDASFTAKLQDEARITASIKHPHVVEVYSVGEDHGQFYVVMELVDGGSLDDRIEDEKRISELEMLEVGLQVAKGLQAALKAGLIHRDIKPGNILFTDRHTAKSAASWREAITPPPRRSFASLRRSIQRLNRRLNCVPVCKSGSAVISPRQARFFSAS